MQDTELSLFKGIEAKLNRDIFQALSARIPLSVWDIKKHFAVKRGLRQTRYHNINARVRALENKGYLRKTCERETKAVGKAALYEVTSKAQFALLVNSLCLDDLIAELDEITSIVTPIATR